MNRGWITCSKCKVPLQDFLNAPDLTVCPSCGVGMQIHVFPSLFRNLMPGQTGDTLLTDQEASCFYHPQKKAVITCEGCGRFLCALCDVELNEQHLCSTCLESGKKKGKLKNLENHRMVYDGMALTLAIVPLLIWPFTIITAPAAIFVAIRYWKAPTSIIPRSKLYFILAILFAGLQVAGWIYFIGRQFTH